MTTDRNSEAVAFASQSMIDALNKCRNDTFNGCVEVWMRPDDVHTVPLYTTPPATIPVAVLEALVERLNTEAAEWAEIHQRTSHGHCVDWEANGRAEAYERASEMVAQLIQEAK